ncbi:MAG: hypothetical protein AAF348_12010 [Bacteroidota bacterium]
MESNKELEFKVMVTFPHLLEKEVKDFNDFYGTDFKIVETIYDEVPFCKLKVTKYEPSHVFDLGYSLAALQYKMREEGEIDW